MVKISPYWVECWHGPEERLVDNRVEKVNKTKQKPNETTAVLCVDISHRKPPQSEGKGWPNILFLNPSSWNAWYNGNCCNYENSRCNRLESNCHNSL